MSESSSCRTERPPGPAWMWWTAWSVQGLALLVVEILGFSERPLLRFVAAGLLAGIPLAILYAALQRRYRRRNG